jgi:hypothetical protein
MKTRKHRVRTGNEDEDDSDTVQQFVNNPPIQPYNPTSGVHRWVFAVQCHSTILTIENNADKCGEVSVKDASPTQNGKPPWIRNLEGVLQLLAGLESS